MGSKFWICLTLYFSHNRCLTRWEDTTSSSNRLCQYMCSYLKILTCTTPILIRVSMCYLSRKWRHNRHLKERRRNKSLKMTLSWNKGKTQIVGKLVSNNKHRRIIVSNKRSIFICIWVSAKKYQTGSISFIIIGTTINWLSPWLNFPAFW